jgi:hypothetical protein
MPAPAPAHTAIASAPASAPAGEGHRTRCYRALLAHSAATLTAWIAAASRARADGAEHRRGPGEDRGDERPLVRDTAQAWRGRPGLRIAHVGATIGTPA